MNVVLGYVEGKQGSIPCVAYEVDGKWRLRKIMHIPTEIEFHKKYASLKTVERERNFQPVHGEFSFGDDYIW